MDLYKLLKSLEESLYEVIVLLVFFPRTLWLTLRQPQRKIDYVLFGTGWFVWQRARHHRRARGGD